MGDHCGLEALFPIEKSGSDAKEGICSNDIYHKRNVKAASEHGCNWEVADAEKDC